MLPERQRDNLGKVKESAEQLLTLINDLLDLSKIEAGRMDVHPGIFDVKRFVQACCETVAPLVKPGVQLRYEIADTVGEAHTDEDGLRQIVLNLLSNAIKFTEVGEVVVRVFSEKQPTNEERLVIAVSIRGWVLLPKGWSASLTNSSNSQEATINRKARGLGSRLPNGGPSCWADQSQSRARSGKARRLPSRSQPSIRSAEVISRKRSL